MSEASRPSRRSRAPAPRYTFGDNPKAERRLRLLAKIFEPSSQDLLESRLRPLLGRPELAVDLGCGPGLTTRLLQRSLGAFRTVGLDASRVFVEAAVGEGRVESTPGEPKGGGVVGEGAAAELSFAQHDVTTVPFPARPATVLYARFLLTHLVQPTSILRRWSGELADGGFLAIEDLEHLSSPHPVLARYYEGLEGMQAARGQETFIGTRLGEVLAEAGFDIVLSRIVPLRPGGRALTELHALNFETWSDEPFVRERMGQEEIDQVGRGLWAIVEGRDEEPAIDYRLRQVIARPAKR